MPKAKLNRVKLALQIEQEDRDRFKQFDYGEQSLIFRNVLTAFIRFWDETGDQAINYAKGDMLKVVKDQDVA